MPKPQIAKWMAIDIFKVREGISRPRGRGQIRATSYLGVARRGWVVRVIACGTSSRLSAVTVLQMTADGHPDAVPALGIGSADGAQKPVILVVDSGREVEGVLPGAAGAVTEGDPPDADVGDRVTGGVRKLA